MLRANAMTIGQLSRRTGVPIKTLREYERLGFIYSPGRSASNYRLFGDEALWCVQVVQSLRSLGLTLKEIHDLVTQYLERPGEPSLSLLSVHLAESLSRVEARMADLQMLRQRILDFQAACAGAPAQPSSYALLSLLIEDPRRGSEESPSMFADTS